MKNMPNILVTGIGGNVGQGIIKNIRRTRPSSFIVGVNIEQFTAINHMCNVVEKVPYATNDEYKHVIKNLVECHGIDLIFPGTEHEALALSAIESLSGKVVVSPTKTLELFFDKWNTARWAAKLQIPFADSCVASDLKKANNWNELIAKPRCGRGSRGVVVNPNDLSGFTDDYLFQECLRGIEITSAFYITADKKLLGPITFSRELENGYTSECEVTRDFDEQLVAIMESVLKGVDGQIIGPFNVQAIVTKEGAVVPFEFNCRYSGTNSIRSHFGFTDVDWAIEEHYFDLVPRCVGLSQGRAIRILSDVIYFDESVNKSINSNYIVN